MDNLLQLILQMQATITRQEARITELERQLGLGPGLPHVQPEPAPIPMPMTEAQKIMKKYPSLVFGQGEITRAKFVSTCYKDIYGRLPQRGQTEALFSSFYEDIRPARGDAYIKGTKIIGVSLITS